MSKGAPARKCEVESAAPSGPSAKKLDSLLGEQIRNFSSNLENLREFVALLSPFLKEHERTFMKAHNKDFAPLILAISKIKPIPGMPEIDADAVSKIFGSKVSVEVLEDGKTCTVTLEDEDNDRFETALKGMSERSGHHSLLYRNALISLISSAEWFLSQMLRKFFEAHPEAAGIKEKVLTFEDLIRLGSVEEARQYLIGMRIDDIIRGSLEDWLKFFTNTANLSMGYLTDHKAKLIEVFQRRNVMVHNNGTVHTSYISKVDANLRKNLKAGDDLLVSPEYLQEAIDLIELNFILIAAELWKRLRPKEEQRALVLINVVAFHCLKAERWKIAEGVSYFAMNDKNLPEINQVLGQLNYWQSVKWQGRFSEIEEAIRSADFSAKDQVSQLARLVLLDDYVSAFKMIPTMMQSGSITPEHLEKWPIFRKLREQPRFLEIKGVVTSIKQPSLIN